MSNEPNKEFRKVSSLKNWDKNPRSISNDGFERLKKQIKKLGQYKPLLITPDGTVIGGNMRLRAYRDLGIEDVWVSVVSPKDDKETLEYALSDNDRAGYYDDDLLANLTSEMPDFNWADYSVDLKEPTNLADLISQFTEVQEDEAPEVSDEPAVSKLGEVYQLGRHRLMCGDSTKIEDVEKLMNGQKADMVFTDPPYGIGIDADYGARMKGKEDFIKRAQKSYSDIIGDDVDFDPSFILGYFKDSKIFLWGANNYTEKLSKGQWFVWYKKTTDGMKRMFGWDFELCWTNQTAGQVYEQAWAGCFGHNKKLDGDTKTHPSMKSVSLILQIFKDYESERVIDLFGGSGSTLIACEQTNRTCYMMEIDPKYCDVIRKRYAKFIGKEESWQKETPPTQ